MRNDMKKVLATSEVAVASDRLYRSVRKVIQEAQGVVSRVANWAMVEANWRVGFLIVEDEQKGMRKAEYGKAVLKRHRYLTAFLSKALGIDDETAEDEACLMEHAISDESFEKWVAYIEELGIVESE